jgi:hypothetical protein
MFSPDRSWENKSRRYQRQAEKDRLVDDSGNSLIPRLPIVGNGILGNSVPVVRYSAHYMCCIGELADVP